ncbi:glycoside hydrolase domain-containing protein [Cellulomonas triticagri]|uniref:DUF1906 domain-containing protein n=1 Tax=Cellulomonas triticagri TaxID=2483352 RepID=A0A3M2JPB9_9CELL|nr:glycoside hydrolase domain-containing protein [Cellulomonas triticagri]RMI12545.1 DUF1906 domain-containing protein [Cellulomonas triticagri]
MDQMVLKAQQYINATYGGRTGYARVTEDGRTGWGTMYGLTRGLQIELGIAQPSNSFGDATRAAFEAQIGRINSATTQHEVVVLLQCALWCKGYGGGPIGDGWSEAVAVSVASVRARLGLAVTDDPLGGSATVPSKLMKSLLTMDAYVQLTGGSLALRAGQQWLNRRYWGRKNFYLVPTDGLYTRQMQQGLMYAIQYGLGMSDSVANGNFGPGTREGLASSGLVKLGDGDDDRSFVSLFQIALAANGYDSPVTGSFDTSTQEAVLRFQTFMEMQVIKQQSPAAGRGDFDTWAALLVSTGNPDQHATGFDTNTPLTASVAAARRAGGFLVAGRYLTVASKALAPGEIEVIHGAGLKLAPIFQNYNNAATYFTRAAGVDHGQQAAVRARELGIGPSTIFFAVDYDATGDEASSIVREYFEGVVQGLRCSAAVRYGVGIYATRNVAAAISQAGLAEAVWVSGMSTGYSGNLGFRMPENWHYNQIQELKDLNIDRNVVSHRARPVGPEIMTAAPVRDGAFHPLHWGSKEVGSERAGLMKLQVLAERCAIEAGVDGPAVLSSELIMFWLQSESYALNDELKTLPWELYTPRYETTLSTVPTIMARAVSARRAFFEAAGDVHALDGWYEGDFQHAAATAHGARIWGTTPGSGRAGVGDLGGWGLDVAQAWDNYVSAGKPQPFRAWAATHVGQEDVSLSGFSRSDAIADADGYLVALAMEGGATFAGAWAQVLASHPTWQQRWRAFLTRRFGSHEVLTQALEHLVSVSNLLPPIGWARWFFVHEHPVGAEARAVAQVLADRFYDLAE